MPVIKDSKGGIDYAQTWKDLTTGELSSVADDPKLWENQRYLDEIGRRGFMHKGGGQFEKRGDDPTQKPTINQNLKNDGISTSVPLKPLSSYDDLVSDEEEGEFQTEGDKRLAQMKAMIGAEYDELIGQRKERGEKEIGGAGARLGITRGLGASSSRMQFMAEMQSNIDADIATYTETKATAMAKLDFEMADKIDAQIRDLEETRFKAQQVSYNQQLQSLQEGRMQAEQQRKTQAGYMDQLKEIATVGGDIPDDLMASIDEIYGSGFSEQYKAATQSAANAKSQSEQVKAATNILNLLLKLPEGEEITIGGNKYTGMKTADVKNKTFSEEDAYGNVTYVTLDEEGNIISKASGGAIGKGRAASTKDTTEKDAVAKMIEQITAGVDPKTGGPIVGDDGFISPDNYKKARVAWVQQGLNPTTFDTKFKGYKNPNNPNYVNTKAGTVKVDKSLDDVLSGADKLTNEQKLKFMGKERKEYSKIFDVRQTEEDKIAKDFKTYLDDLVKKYRDEGKSDEEIAKLMQ